MGLDPFTNWRLYYIVLSDSTVLLKSKWYKCELGRVVADLYVIPLCDPVPLKPNNIVKRIKNTCLSVAYHLEIREDEVGRRQAIRKLKKTIMSFILAIYSSTGSHKIECT